MLFRLLLRQLGDGLLKRLQALLDSLRSAIDQTSSHCQINIQWLMPFFNLTFLYDAFRVPHYHTKLLLKVTRVQNVLNLSIFDPDSSKVLCIYHHASTCFKSRSLDLRLQCLREGAPMQHHLLEFCTLLSHLLELLQSRFHLRTTSARSSSQSGLWSWLYDVFDYFRFCYWHFL